MAIYGVTDTGFVRPTMEDIRAQIEAKYRGYFGASIDTDPSTPDGQLINTYAEREDLVWQLAEVIYGMMDPDKARGAALDSLCLITGTYRDPASFSTAVLTLTGDPGTVIGTGSQAKTSSTDIVFASAENGSLVALTAWTAATAYVVGDRCTNGGNAYICITAGTSAGSGGPTSSTRPAANDIADNTVHWLLLGVGTAADDVLAGATVTGPLVAVAGDITEIDTQVAGWEGVYNLLDATPGADRTSDQGLRLLREFELAASGDSPIPAIKRAVSRVDDVTSVTVFYNNTTTTNGDGLPPNSVEVLVQGGTDEAVAAALFNAVAGGIGYYGTETVTHTDSENEDHEIKFSRMTAVNVYVTLAAEVNADEFPTDGIAQMKAAIAAFGDEQSAGKNAVASSISKAAFVDPDDDGGIGVLDIDPDTLYVYTDVIGTPTAWLPATAYVATPGARSVVTNGGRAYICITSGTSAGSGGPSGKTTDITDNTAHWRYLGATIQIDTRSLAVFDTSRINISTTDGTP